MNNENQEFKSTTRELNKPFWHLVTVIGVISGLFHLFGLLIYPIDPWVYRALHFSTVTCLAFFLYPATKKSISFRPSILDLAFAALVLIPPVYILLTYDQLIERVGVTPTNMDLIVGLMLVIPLLEITRRSTGWALPILAMILLLYSYFGYLLPGSFWHRGYDIERIISYLFSVNGIYNIPLGVASTYVFVFILFGTLLEASGSGQFFMKLANSIAGKYRGGPAKVSIFSSSLMGTINGSAVANVASTGAFTIPLMKRIGYKPRFAGATEAVASTGGQLLPPVMGAGAFIMADITGIPYPTIMIAAIIPACLYFLSVLFMVDFEAAKLGLRGIPKVERPNLIKLLKEQGLLLLPLLLIVYLLLIQGYSPIRSALLGAGLVIVLSWLTKYKVLIISILKSVGEAMVKMIPITTTCATAGLMIGVFSLTGLGSRISRIIVSWSGENLFVLLFLVMMVCIILGMGLPTVAAYTLAASTVAPALTELDVPLLAAHLFVFYFASISTITPPVALSAFAGAAIAGEKPMKVGWQALKLGAAAYIVPFMFVLDSNLLLQGDFGVMVFTDVFTALLGILALAIAMQGYFLQNLNIYFRVIYFLLAMMLVVPIVSLSTLGIGIMVILILVDVFKRKQKQPASDIYNDPPSNLDISNDIKD
ncbi:TRAP transporter permease [Salibacterium aidingense]|uniref:TRAP transporter permease n=1 Tax=Salibacterium aidingense TaxID=384933 RepID=UPI00040EF77C|nr:TRAP transporter permease [Salibacterium aidingense]